MNDKEHRLGVSEVNLVVRHLKLEPTKKNKIQTAIAEIDQLYGIERVSFDEKPQVISLAYDATRLCLDGIDNILKKHEVEISEDWWTHFKEEYYKFVDENVKNNAEHQPWSCHSVPPKVSSKKNHRG